MGYKARLALLITVQATVLAFVAAFTYRPGVAGVETIEKELDALSERQAELCRIQSRRPSPEAEAQRTLAEIKRLEHRMPPENRVSWLSARVSRVMRAHHLDLRAASDWHEDEDKPGTAELKRLRKEVTVRGTAKNLQAFLTAINELPFVVIVEHLDVLRDEKWGRVSATIRLATFVLRNRPLTGTAESEGQEA
jgi:hypothetical protein